MTLMRTTPEENTQLGILIAEKLNRARGPVAVVMPLGGVSMIDVPGAPFHDPVADAALFAALRGHLSSDVEVIELETHINDPAVAQILATTFHRLYTAWKERDTHGITH